MNYKIINNLIYSLILFSGCSFYSFKGSLPENIKSVYIHQINNDTSEYVITNLLNESIRDRLINQNLLNIVDEYNSDSQLILKIKSVDDLPNVYNNLNDKYEIVEQWKLNIKVKIIWKDIYSDKILIDKDISEWAMYDNSGIDVGMDQIDNDLDGLLDAEDSDEYGSSREAALRIVSSKISNRIIDELTSTW
jgi:hypothetical protein